MISRLATLNPRTVALMALLLFIPVYVYGVYAQWQINTDMVYTDQKLYMNYAKGLAEDITFRGDRNRMPIYPFIQSLHYDAGQSDYSFFATGKAVNVAIGTLVLAAVIAFFWHKLPPHLAAMGGIITGLFVFAYMAPYFQTELLFYGLYFLCFLLLLHLLNQPSYRLTALTGFLLGVAHLTKASVMFMPAIFTVVFGLKAWQESSSWRVVATRLLIPMLVIVTFLATIAPYLAQSKKHYGTYFYNANTTFYIWYDSWYEVEAGTRSAGDWQSWPDMPEDELPSMRKYLREHTLGDIIYRFARGLWMNFYLHLVNSYGYAKYILLYGLLLLDIAIKNRQRTLDFIRRNRWSVLFVAGIFTLYHLSYAWYVPINAGRRFLLSLWLPALFVVLWLLRNQSQRRFHLLMMVVLIADVSLIWWQHIAHFRS